jgi:hypothetical protein
MPTPPHPADAPPTKRFNSAEEAWFWLMRAEKARDDGKRSAARSTTEPRPCEPGDIFRWVDQLYQAGALYPLHVEVLSEYGYLDRMPYPDHDEEVIDWVIWIDAFDTIDPILRAKGIIE